MTVTIGRRELLASLGVAARGARAADGQAADLGFLGPTAHSAANEWVAALAQRLRDVET